jgi:oligoribonuclease NrnB/cAMP/cGMP phosphodiesterase (DHH superfamily)
MKSLVGNMLAKKHGPFALVVTAHPKGFGVSIRGDGSVDVSLIAQKYGGNGHKNSSGFLIPVGGPMPWTIVENEDSRD